MGRHRIPPEHQKTKTFKCWFKMNIGIFVLPLFLLGCQHFEKLQVSPIGQVVNSGQNAILANCEFFNLEGVAIRKYPGDLCVPFENGDLVIMDQANLTKLNKDNVILWTHPEHVHHQMKSSLLNDDVLAISSIYTGEGRNPMRHDVVKVIDPNGRTKKQFEFSKYFDTKQREAGKQKRDWMPNWREKLFYEYTHINSISEILETNTNGARELKGYLVNDRATRKLFFLDPDMQKVLKVFDLQDEPKHDVSFIDSVTILYYANHNRSRPKKSYVVSYNLNSNEKKIVYGDSTADFYSKNNGGVQVLSQGLYLVSHSPEDTGSYVEFVNSEGKVLRKIVLKGTRRLIQEAKLHDYSGFLRNNIGN